MSRQQDETKQPYQLQSTSSGFQSRSKDIFANLDSIADNKSKIHQRKNEDDTHSSPKNRQDRSRSPPTSRHHQHDDRSEKRYSKEFKGRESIFRTPNESGWPPSRSDFRSSNKSSRNFRQNSRKFVPDHVKNPGSYTKYDLSDVSRDQMSDRSNTRAAFDFLRQLKDRKHEDDDISEDDLKKVDEGKISFKKPKKPENSSNESGSSSSNVVKDGVKRVMPECVVGQKPKSSVVESKLNSDSTKKSKKSNKKQISLAHLDDEEEDD